MVPNSQPIIVVDPITETITQAMLIVAKSAVIRDLVLTQMTMKAMETPADNMFQIVCHCQAKLTNRVLQKGYQPINAP